MGRLNAAVIIFLLEDVALLLYIGSTRPVLVGIKADEVTLYTEACCHKSNLQDMSKSRTQELCDGSVGTFDKYTVLMLKQDNMPGEVYLGTCHYSKSSNHESL